MKRKTRLRLAGIAVISALTLAILLLCQYTPQPLIGLSDQLSPQAPATTIYFLDVGQGDSALIVSGDDAILIDGGPRSAGDTVVEDLHALGIDHLTAVIATHPHQDHIGGLISVLEELPVDTIYMSDVIVKTKTFRKFFRTVLNCDAGTVFPDIGSTIEMDGGAVLTNLGPGPHASLLYGTENCNPCSLVFRLDVYGRSVLFTADTTKESEHDMVERGELLECDVLKVAHHGDKSSTSEEFLNAARPTYGVISYGADNPYGVPEPVVLQRLEQFDVTLFTTVSNGIVTLTITPDSLRFT
ncbi:MAG: ComEC/Rec2 family competence protein [Eubacteriales bacterium]|nr:ComEC/Rec2 family competence protein [Eubacteriales bacterium]